MSEHALATVDPTPIRQHTGPRLGLPTSAELKALADYGEVVVKSGMAPAHIKTWQAAVVVMRYGHQLGIDEFTALQNLFIIGGKPAAMASLLHAVILRDHGGDAIEILEASATACRLSCRRRGSQKVTEVGYTLKEADAAGLTGAPGSTWKKYPADLLFARAVSRAGRQVFRDSTMGLYVPEEIGGSVIEVQGEVVDVESRETPARLTGSITPSETVPTDVPVRSATTPAPATKSQILLLVDYAKQIGISNEDVTAIYLGGRRSSQVPIDEMQAILEHLKAEIDAEDRQDVADDDTVGEDAALTAGRDGAMPGMPPATDRYAS